MDFSQALLELKNGARMARSGWNGKDMWIALKLPDEHKTMSKPTLPYLYMKTVSSDLVPWVASQMDLLSADWEVVPVR